MVRNVKRIIERHPFTQRLRPSRSDQWASDQFTVRRLVELRDPSMLAKGIEANITGLRADIVICDDVEVPNTSDTPLKRANLRTRLDEIEYVLVPGGLQLYVGTPHSFYTIYAAEIRTETGEVRPFLDGFQRLEVPLLDGRGSSRWPERFPSGKIEAIRRRTGPNKFQSQMMLEPRSISEGRLDPERIHRYDNELVYSEGNSEAILMLGQRRVLSASCWWDPSYGAPDKGDASVVAAVFTDENGDYFLHRICYLEHDPAQVHKVDEATQLCRKVANFVRDLYVPSVTLETNGLGRFLPGLLRQELRIGRTTCAVIERTATRNKNLRIIDAFDAVLAAGRLSAHQSVWSTPFITEMREWSPGSRGRDDGLDAVAGCLLSEPVRISKWPVSSAGEVLTFKSWRPGSNTYRAEYDFNV
jgi:hypothetical protein